jgi:hypothetical protein
MQIRTTYPCFCKKPIRHSDGFAECGIGGTPFGSLLIQDGASLTYVKEQEGAQLDSDHRGHIRSSDSRSRYCLG